MKTLAASILFLFSASIVIAQAGTWTLMKGSATGNVSGNYGTKGVSAVSNVPPAKYDCGFWTDTAHNFWVYSGNTYGLTAAADMWRYTPSNNRWTWMQGDSSNGNLTVAAAKGVFDSSNTPGPVISPIMWVDDRSRLWLYSRSDLWVYDLTLNQWAWMGGAQGNYAAPVYGTKGIGTVSTRPGSREATKAAWQENNQLFFFGGSASSLFFNDVWRYDINTGIWTWMAGSNIPNNQGSYGTKGVASANYLPWSRDISTFWRDGDGNCWFFGGTNNLSAIEGFDDVWKLNPVTWEWTWVDGHMMSTGWTADWSGLCISDARANPERTVDNAFWKLCDNLVLIFGGRSGYWYNSVEDKVWWYSTSTEQWAFADVFTPLFSRMKCSYFVNKNGYPYLFGGVGDYHTASWNALYRYAPNPACVPLANCPVPPLRAEAVVHNPVCEDSCEATATIVTTNGQSPVTYQWSDTSLSGGVVSGLCAGIYFVTITDGSNRVVIDTFEIRPPYQLSATLTATSNNFCASDSLHMCAPTGFTTYLWNTGENTDCIYVQQAGNYYVTITDNYGCTAESNHLAITVLPLPPVAISINGDTLSVHGAVTQQWYLNGSAISNATSNTYIANQSGSYTVMVTDSNGCVATSSAVIISGIDNLSEEDVVSVYQLTVDSWQLTVGNSFLGGEAEMFDGNGRLVFQSAIQNPQSEISPAVAKGIYLLRISSAKSSVVRKLVRL